MKSAQEPRSIGRPSQWKKEDAVRAVYRLCKDGYVKAKDFPPYLYKLCGQFFGSVRAAKWEARILHGKNWTYDPFIQCVYQYAKKKYREDGDWPANLRALAKRFCGSIRAAKWQAGVIQDNRRKIRDRYKLEGLWTKKKFVKEFKAYCLYGYKKPAQIPGYMRFFAVKHFGSIRSAKWACRILPEPRKFRRRDGS